MTIVIPALLLLAELAFPPVEQVRAHLAGRMAKLPNYTCIQETQRYRREPRARNFERVDSIRLQVLVAGDRELFAWPGDENFSDQEIRDIVRNGAIGSGLFGLFTRQLFTSRSTAIEEAPEGYRFRVPQLLSGYAMLSAAGRTISGYEGTFRVDPATMDLVALHIIATDLPPDLRYGSVEHTVTFGRMIDVGSALLPAAAFSVLKEFSGREFRNDSRFTGCREFSVNSRILEDGTPVPARAAPTATRSAPDLPPGLSVKVRLRKELDGRVTAVGDTFSAVVTEEIKRGDTMILAKGTVFAGRVRGYERQDADTWMVSLRFTFPARLEATSRKKSIIRDIGAGGSYAGIVPTRDFVPDPLTEWEKENGTLVMRDGRLPSGFGMTWITGNTAR